MQLKVAVVDDDRLLCSDVQDNIRAWGAYRDVDVSVSVMHSTAEFDAASGAEGPFHVVFLDIDLGKSATEGLEIARRLHEEHDPALTVFLTNSSQFLSLGYRVRAYRYLCKPLKLEELHECLDAAIADLTSTTDSTLTLKSRERIVRVPFKDILYLSVNGKHITVHTRTGSIKHRAQMSEIVDALPAQFVRCSRWDIVNMDHVTTLDLDGIKMADGSRLRLSQRFKKAVMAKFMERPLI